MKKIMSILMVILMLSAIIPLSASALVVDDWEVEISEGNAYLIGYSGAWPDKVTLPTYVGNFAVRGIKGLQFGANVSEIVVPEGYVALEEKTTKNLYQTDRVLVSVLNNLRKITLPQSLEVLGIEFTGCSKLEEITIPPKVKSLPQFNNCKNLKHVSLSNGLEIIEANAFNGCTALKDFKIPDTVTEIQKGAFVDCDSLVNMIIPDSVVVYGNPETKNMYPSAGVFQDCDNLESLVIGDGVQELDDVEMKNCPKLKYVYLGNSMKNLLGPQYMGLTSEQYLTECGPLGFATSLKTVILPPSLQNIGQLFLTGCDNVESVVIPKSVTKIGPPDGMVNSAGNYVFRNYNGKPLPKLFIYGYKGTTAETFANQKGFPFVDISIATPTNSKVIVNGKEVGFTAYNIGGNNYFKLRDIAAAINGTSKNFNVGWDGNNNAISLTSNTSYVGVGGELVVNANATATEPKISNPKIFVDGKLTTFMAFNIADNNYIKLRDLGEVFNFGVNWDASTQTIAINTNQSYTK